MKFPHWQTEIAPLHVNAMAVIRKATGETPALIIRQLVLEADPNDWKLATLPWCPETKFARNPRMRWKTQPGKIHHEAMMRLIAATDEQPGPIIRQLVLRRAGEILDKLYPVPPVSSVRPNKWRTRHPHDGPGGGAEGDQAALAGPCQGDGSGMGRDTQGLGEATVLTPGANQQPGSAPCCNGAASRRK